MSNRPPHMPIALTIAGSDSGGGAGIQADLKTFAALGVYGTSAITAITAQNPGGVSAIQGIDPSVVAAQIEAVLDYFPVGAVKIGMLLSADIVEAVAGVLAPRLAPRLASTAEGGRIPLVVDPVMVATSGAKLLDDSAMEALRNRILPLATLLTPNMDEAALLAGMEVATEDDLEQAAKKIQQLFSVPVLVKGGHMKKSGRALDILWDGAKRQQYESPFLTGLHTHGTGCTLSSAIAVFLLRGAPLAEAVGQAKVYLHHALSHSLPDGRATSLNHAAAPIPLKPMA